MDAPIYRTKDSQKVQASLYSDRLELMDLTFNPLNTRSRVELSKIEEANLVTAGPGQNPQKVSLSLKIKGETPLMLSDLDAAEAHNLKETIQRLQSAPVPEDPQKHAFTIGGRVSLQLAQKEGEPKKTHLPVSRFRSGRFKL